MAVAVALTSASPVSHPHSSKGSSHSVKVVSDMPTEEVIGGPVATAAVAMPADGAVVAATVVPVEAPADAVPMPIAAPGSAVPISMPISGEAPAGIAPVSIAALVDTVRTAVRTGKAFF